MLTVGESYINNRDMVELDAAQAVELDDDMTLLFYVHENVT